MSLVRCVVIGCPNMVREGLRRPTYDGQPKADGRRCWRCRAGRRGHLDLKEGTLTIGGDFEPLPKSIGFWAFCEHVMGRKLESFERAVMLKALATTGKLELRRGNAMGTYPVADFETTIPGPAKRRRR